MKMSGEDSFYRMSWLDPSDFLVQSTIREDEAIVINTKLMKDGSIQVPDVYRVLCYTPAVVIGFSVSDSSLDTPASHPDREGSSMVISSRSRAVQLALLIDRASKFSTPDDKGFVEQAPLFEVEDKGGRGLVSVLALTGQLGLKRNVLVPAAVRRRAMRQFAA